MIVACGGGRIASPPPATPIAAPPAAPDRPATDVCGELVANLERYGACVEDDRKRLIEAWHEYAKTNFAALAHDTISEGERAEVARGCYKADVAIRAALARSACSKVPAP